MTEPNELRSIDELFRNTFNNLPETPADSGWDLPSERVWKHVSDNIQTPKSGWSTQTLMLLAGLAVTLALGLYLAFAGAFKDEVKPAEPASPPAVVVETPAAQPQQTETVVAVEEKAPVVSVPKQPVQRSVAKPVVAAPVEKETPKEQPVIATPAPVIQEAVQTPQTNAIREATRSSGAAPLPGEKNSIPNTTEARKAEHARQLEQLWQTPLKPLPVLKNPQKKH